MVFYKCKLLRVYDSSLPIRIYLISTSLTTLVGGKNGDDGYITALINFIFLTKLYICA